MRTIYNIFFTIFFVLASPYYFWRMRRRGNWQTGFSQRFGKFDSKFKQSISNRQTLWMHAVSVGEVNVCTQLIRALEPRFPNLKIVVSTTTTTGMGELQKKLPTHVGKIYYPIDYRKCVSRALTTVYPEAVVLVEAEIWPNFIWRARNMGIPLFLVNARLSDRSYRGYKRFGFLFRPLFASFTCVGAQNETDAARLCELGCRPEAVHVVGSLKFDAAQLDTQRMLNVPGMLRQLSVPSHARLLVAGSTHDGEEELIGRIFLKLKKQFPDLFLVLVPRHFERGREVGKQLRELGVDFIYRTDISKNTQLPAGQVNCLLVNTTGELKFFYDYATLVFIGKSILGMGGQNPIEPGAMGKPIVFGPNMQNFSDIVRAFLTQDGAVQVQTPEELEQKIAELLADEPRREELGRNARKVVLENLGAIDRTVNLMVKNLEDRQLYMTNKEG